MSKVININHKITFDKLKQNLFRFVISAVVIIVIALVLFLGGNYFNFSRNFGRGTDSEGVLEWKGDRGITIVVLGVDKSNVNPDLRFLDAINLIHIQPEQPAASIISIDPDLNIPVATSDEVQLAQEVTTYYEYRQIYNLFRNELSDTEALEKTISELSKELGIDIDRYVWIEKEEFIEINNKLLFKNGVKIYQEISEPNQKLDEKLNSQLEQISTTVDLVRNPFFRLGVLFNASINYSSFANIKTNLNMTEINKLYGTFGKIPQTSIQTGFIEQKQIYIYESKKFLSKEVFDRELQSLLRDEDILLEQARIDVINGTGEPGLAGRTRRILTNHSFNIVRVDNSLEDFSQPTLYVKEQERYAKTISKLKIFYPDLLVIAEEYSDRPTGDMVLIVIE